MRRLKAALGSAALIAAMMAAVPASASDFIFTFRGNSPVAGYDAPMDFTATSKDGQTLSVRASAWSIGWNAKYGTATYKANLGAYYEGLGVTSYYENGYNNSHTIDNQGEPEFVLLQFSAPVVMTSITTSPWSLGGSADSDATVAWGNTAQPWNSTLDLDWKATSALTEILTQTAVSGGKTATTSKVNFGAPANLWLVAASLTNPDGKIDGFKLGGITASTGAVPEPATWMTMILGFGLIGYALRRRKTARDVAAA